MEAIEAVAIMILVIAIIILVYYYLLNSPETAQKLRNIVPKTADAHLDEVLGKDSDYADLSKEDNLVSDESESMSKRIKVNLSDIDMSGLNTDAFSNKIDAFLDEKGMDMEAHYSIPAFMNERISQGTRVKVVETPAKWMGLVSHDDKIQVLLRINEMMRKGVYPRRLFERNMNKDI